MRNSLKNILLLAALTGLLVLGVCYFGPGFGSRNTEPENLIHPLRQCTVALGDISNRVGLAGKIRPLSVEEIVCRVEARIGDVLVKEGQLVKQGDVLIKLDEKDLRRKVEDARIKYIKAKIKMDELESWKKSQSYLTAKFQLETAQTDFEEGKRTYEENVGLFEQKAISKYDQHQSRLDLRRREIALETARVQLIEQEKKAGGMARQEARSELLVAESNLAEKTTALQFKDIIAPCDGIVSFEQGGSLQQKSQNLTLIKNRVVNAGEFLLKIENYSRFAVEARVNEFDAVRLTRGTPCTIYVPAIPDEEFSGAISAIYPVNSGGDRTFFEVRCPIDQSDTPLKSGLTAEVEIILEEKMDVLLIPLAALVAGDDKTGVLVVGGNGEVSFVPVEIGLKSRDQVEIVSGLEAGQKIVSRISSELLKLSGLDGSVQ